MIWQHRYRKKFYQSIQYALYRTVVFSRQPRVHTEKCTEQFNNRYSWYLGERKIALLHRVRSISDVTNEQGHFLSTLLKIDFFSSRRLLFSGDRHYIRKEMSSIRHSSLSQYPDCFFTDIIKCDQELIFFEQLFSIQRENFYLVRKQQQKLSKVNQIKGVS